MARRARLVAGIILFVIGATVFLYPSVGSWLAQREAYAAIDAALAGGSSTGSVAGIAGSSVPGTASYADASSQNEDPQSGSRVTLLDENGRELRQKDGDPAYEFLAEYNARVAAGTAGPINDPWGEGSDKSALADVGLPDGLLGSVSVPALGVTLPLYLGSTYENMARGGTVISGTSAPLGQEGSNCVIAAHRAKWSGLAMFRDIENMRVGDELTIETPWDTLTYRAAEIRIVSPDDIEAVGVQPGRDLVTLLTCHPYGHNYQRYLVICERADGAGAVREGEGLLATLARPVEDVLEPSDSPLLVAERWLRVAGFALMAGMAARGVWLLAQVLRGCRCDEPRAEANPYLSAKGPCEHRSRRGCDRSDSSYQK